MKKYNNKKRQSAVFSSKHLTVYSKYLRGEKIRNGYFKNDEILMPKALQEEISEQYKNISNNIMKSLGIESEADYILKALSVELRRNNEQYNNQNE